MVSSTPAPLVSMLPPSSTSSCRVPSASMIPGVNDGSCSNSATLSGSALSSSQSGYFAHALNFQLVIASRRCHSSQKSAPNPASRRGSSANGGSARWTCSLRALQHPARSFLRIGILDKDVDLFDSAEMPHDLRIHPRDGLKASRPVARIVRPRDPRRGVRLPFRRHAKAQRARRGVLRSSAALTSRPLSSSTEDR